MRRRVALRVVEAFARPATRRRVASAVAVFCARPPVGDDFAWQYAADEAIFRRLLAAEQRLARDLRRFFAGQAQRLDRLVRWDLVEAARIRRPVIAPVALQEPDYTDSDAWQEEDAAAAGAMAAGMRDAAAAGADGEASRWGRPRSQSSREEARQWADRHAAEQARGMNETTRRRVQRELARCIDEEEGTRDCAERLRRIIDDPRRARTIAQTETIRAYSKGTLIFGKSTGADRKQWLDGQPNACPVCTDLDEMIVPIDDDFGGIDAPPAHPNCRCAVITLGGAEPEEL